MVLHTINQSPYTSNVLDSCLEFCRTGDAVLFLEDGIYALSHPDTIKMLTAGLALYVIEADLLARGFSERRHADIKAIDYDEFVTLCVQFPRQKNW